MNHTIDQIQNFILRLAGELANSIVQTETIVQLAIALLCIGCGLVAGIAVKRIFKNKITFSERVYPVARKFSEITLKQTPLIFIIIIIFICATVLHQIKHPSVILYFMGILITARVLIKILRVTFFSEFWGKVFAVSVWMIVILFLFDLLEPMSTFLDQIGFKMGKIHITALSIFKAFVVCSVLLFFGNYLSKLLEQKLDNIPELTGSTAVLLVKTAKAYLPHLSSHFDAF